MTQDDLPGAAGRIAQEQPALWAAYGELGKACAEAGPLDARTRRLVKLALAIGARSEGAVHSHVRRARTDGLGPEELHHVALLCVPTLGLPRAVAAYTWIDDILNETG